MITDRYEFEIACYRLEPASLAMIEALAGEGQISIGKRDTSTLCDVFYASSHREFTRPVARRILETRKKCEVRPDGLAAKVVALRDCGTGVPEIADRLSVSRWRVGLILRKEVWRRKAAGEPVPRRLLPRQIKDTGEADYVL